MLPTIRIIYPSSSGDLGRLQKRIKDLNDCGFNVLYEHVETTSQKPMEARYSQLINALKEPESQLILCARGGYGASDLLSSIPWPEIQKLPYKWIIGFSDITAIQSAVASHLGWPSLHAPMPDTDLWGLENKKDINALLNLMQSRVKNGIIQTTPLNNLAKEASIDSLSKPWVFGGCFSVLTNLIGTSYLPSLDNALILFEDTSETPSRILRSWNQWKHSGVLKNARGIIWGSLGLGSTDQISEEQKLKTTLSQSETLPIWSSSDFGHISPNIPYVIGSFITDYQPQSSQFFWEHSHRKEST